MTNLPNADDDTLVLTTDIVAAYVQKNVVPLENLRDLIANVHSSLSGLNMKAEEIKPALIPAVPVKKSVKPDALTCLECGKIFKSLKRHLMTFHSLTPADYRDRWHLAADYPMVAPQYSDARSSLAKKMGLGQRSQASRSKRKKAA